LSLHGKNPASLTPALRQYFQAKELAPEAFLFFQVGDFYELFFDDALKVAPLLDLTLTSRQKVDGEPVPMCGVPLAAGDSYINRLAGMGYKVSVCEQSAPPVAGRGPAERVIRRVVTPGTIMAPEAQSPNLSRYIAVLHLEDSYAGPRKTDQVSYPWSMAAIEASTGEFILSRFSDSEGLLSELAALEPSEILCPAGSPPELKELPFPPGAFRSELPGSLFHPEKAIETLSPLYGEEDRYLLDNLGPGPLSAAGAALGYLLSLCQERYPEHLSRPHPTWESPYLGLDEAAIRNLELFRSLRDGGRDGTLLSVLDRSLTPMGGRLLRTWLARPLRDKAAIEARHEAISQFIADRLKREEGASLLKGARDLERSLSRLTLGRGALRDLVAVRETLRLAPALKSSLSGFSSPLLSSLSAQIGPAPPLLELLARAMIEEIPPGLPEGAALAPGFSPTLDLYRDLERGGKKAMAALEARERARSGISTLKVGYNKVFGYYLEVTKSHLASVPPDWIRRQTISGGERYLTPELKAEEERILSAGEKREALEKRILENLKGRTAREGPYLKNLGSVLAQIDALMSLAATAEKKGWTRPRLTEDDLIEIEGGRHPVVEEALGRGEPFVANDIRITPKERLLIVTGPNMAGKSTILRQTAIIVILSQMGSFVPAARAKLSIRDQVFTRVGASDDLARGRSTFMVEMSETARILSQATPRSLVILDEVGRGTSTYDGLAIAWAVAEYLHDLAGRGVPTLFATHYHELIELEKYKPLTRNYNVSVKKWGERIVFLRKLSPGGTSRSYGLAVAGLAGLPAKVIKRAQDVLADLASDSKKIIRSDRRPGSLFPEEPRIEDDPKTRLLRQMESLKIEELTPLEALNILTRLKDEASEALS
jgi:DNA mismatch repair protein MutS